MATQRLFSTGLRSLFFIFIFFAVVKLYETIHEEKLAAEVVTAVTPSLTTTLNR